MRAKQKNSNSYSQFSTQASTCSSNQKKSSTKKKKREEARFYQENKLLKEEIVKLEKQQALIKKRLQGAKNKSTDDKCLKKNDSTLKKLEKY